MKSWFTLLALLLLSTKLLYPQFTTVTVDGTIGENEYGTHTNGYNMYNNVYMTWDNTNLYVGITGATASEAAILYIDKDPLTPINGGSNSDGSLIGKEFDNTNFEAISFRADIVFYEKDSYHEYRTANGSGGWGSGTVGYGTYSYNGGTREFSIPWSLIGGRPSSFAWFLYVTSSGGYVYSQQPPDNPSAYIGTTSRNNYYYIVSSTSDGSSTPPFSRSSYIFNSASDITGFGAITVYDFTMNSSGRTLSRASGGAWTINGNLIIGGGTISSEDCGSKINVAGDFQISSGASFSLSSAIGGDLEVGGNWSNSGTFTCSEREVLFDGTSAQTLTGATNFDYFRINNSNGLTLNNSIVIDNELQFDAGLITIGANNLTLNSGATLDGTPGATKMIVATSTGEVRKVYTGAGSFTFPVGDNTGTAEYSPVTLNFTSGTFSDAYAAVKLSDAKHPGNTSSTDFISRYWTVTSSGISSFSCNASFIYVDADINGTEGNLYCGRYNGSSWALLNAVDAGTNTLSGTVSAFSEFTGGQMSALPVELKSFSAKLVDGKPSLTWQTATEINNYGFDVERSTDKSNWSKIGFVQGAGNSNSPKNYNYTDNTAVSGKYFYRLKQVDTDGTFDYSPVVEVDMGILPGGYRLEQNYPNPFNPSTSIKFAFSKDTKAAIKVYNALGVEVREIYNGIAEAGRVYDIKFNAAGLSSGVYYYKLITPEKTDVRKMMLTK
ncbi:MAG: T9SS type A sorting domain-containing protein [Ignavibacteriaceae bacterium]|nr:T9SS type A sorting domain-containing protein [Ignavibacteriaceae bacterium]